MNGVLSRVRESIERASKSLPRGAHVAALAALCASTSLASSGTVVISDQNFAPAGWTHSILWSNPTVTLGPMTQQFAADCGGAAVQAFQQGRHTSSGSFAGLYDGHLYVGGGSYNPSAQKAINNLDVSFCLKNITGTTNSIQIGLLVTQGTRTFSYFVDSNGPHTNWTTLSKTGITDVPGPSWQEYGPGNTIINGTTPDFSSNGLPLTFGYYTFNWSLPQGFNLDNTWGIDNFTVTIHTSSIDSFCFGGANCPCANPGAAGNGCANVAFASGALLGATGTASVGADTILLTSSSMSGNSSLYFQATGQAAIPFGYGINCLSGTLVRVGLKGVVSGSSTNPSGVDMPISVKGGVPAGGGVRHYQTVYRQVQPPCSPTPASLTNRTNGLTIQWAP